MRLMVRRAAFQPDAFQFNAFQTGLAEMRGHVSIDDVETVGAYSIIYEDLAHDGLPIQIKRRSVEDRVLVDNDNIGNVTVEWDDKVSDITPGYRFIRVLGTVRVVD